MTNPPPPSKTSKAKSKSSATNPSNKPPKRTTDDPSGHRTWHHTLFSCGSPSDLSTCLTGVFCPCILYSRLLYRLSAKSRRSDPTDLLGFSSCNAHCILFGTLCLCGGLSGLLAGIASARVRHAYDIEGSLGDDASKACCCCCCCAIVQGEREVREREMERGMWAGPAVGDPNEFGLGSVNGTAAPQRTATAVMEPDQEVYARRDGMLYQAGGG